VTDPEELKEDLIKLADYFYRMVEGDDVVLEAFQILQKYDLIDDDGFWK
jgi:hypothetical protein